MRYKIADILTKIANWLDGSGWNYDEFDHGYREGLRAARKKDKGNGKSI